MSFRTKLGLFFLLLVAIPIAAIAVLVTDVTGDSENGKADASVSTGLRAALSVYRDETDAATEQGKDLLADPQVLSALGGNKL